MVETAKNRVSYIDDVSGLLIVYMIFHHILQFSGIPQPKVMNILLFFMAWFFFKSGMFHKDKDLKTVWTQELKRLIKPFVVYNLLGVVLQSIKLMVSGDTNWIHYVSSPVKQLLMLGAVEGNLALWFLLTLFIVKVSYAWLRQYFSENAVTAISFAAAFILHFNVVTLPLYVGNSAMGLFFYCAGNKLRDKHNEPIWAISAFLLYLINMLTYPSYIGVRSNEVLEGYYILGVIAAICGCISINKLFALLNTFATHTHTHTHWRAVKWE